MFENIKLHFLLVFFLSLLFFESKIISRVSVGYADMVLKPTIFACSYGAKVEFFFIKKCRKSCDTICIIVSQATVSSTVCTGIYEYGL